MFAAGITSLINLFASGCVTHGFFGLKPWYEYLHLGHDCNITTFNIGDLPLILLAILDDLLRIAGLVALGFVVYGAIQFIASQGSPEEASKARSTIINALLGLAIAIFAITFVSYLGHTIG